jgi:hypothetical protein
MRLIPLLAAAGAAARLYNKYGKSRGAGSQTNASDAVDDIELPPNPTQEEMLDAGVQETFPASDPVAVDKVETAFEKQNRRLGGN